MRTRSLIDRLLSRSIRTRTTPRPSRGSTVGRPIEEMEARSLPATFTASGTQLTLGLNTADESVAIVSTGSTYTLTLTGDTWSGTNAGSDTGNGTSTLTVAAGTFTSGIAIQDSAAGIAVNFNDSGVNTYTTGFNVTLQNALAGAITFNGATTFTGSGSLQASTTQNLTVASGAVVSATGASDSLNLTGGNVLVNGNVTGGGGGVTIVGSGHATGEAPGVLVQSGATVTTSTSTGAVTVTGTAIGGGSGSDAGVSVYGTITSAGGSVTVSGTGAGTEDNNAGVSVQHGGTIGSGGSGTVTVIGTGGTGGDGDNDAGVFVLPNGSIQSSGSVVINGIGGVSAGDDDAGVSVNGSIGSGGSGTITITGTGGAATGFAEDGVLISGNVQSNGGAVSVTASAASSYYAVSVSNDGSISTGSNAPITITSDSLLIDSTSTINSGTGTTTIQTRTPGTLIDLGGTGSLSGSPLTLGLSTAELGAVTAGVLRIGAGGPITVTAAVTAPAGWDTLSMTGSTVGETAAGSLTVAALNVSSAGTVTLNAPNDVTTLAADVNSGFSAAAFTFDNGANPLTVGVVDGDNGITTTYGAIHLIADDMDLAGPVSASDGNGVVTLEPSTATETINLGTNSANDLGLTAAELNEVHAGTLRIGSNRFAGDIVVSTPISPTGIGSFLSLITTGAGTISQGAGGTIAVNYGNGGLDLQAATPVALTADNNVGDVAAEITGAGNGFSFTDPNGFTVGAVDIVNGITTTGPGAVITLTSGAEVDQDPGIAITGDQLMLLGAGPYALNDPGNAVNTLAADVTGTDGFGFTDGAALTVGRVAGTTGITGSGGPVTLTTVGQDLTVAAGATVSTTGADVTLNAGTDLTVDGGITTTGAIVLTGDFDNPNTTTGTTITIAPSATLNAQSATVTGSTLADTFDIAPSAATPITVHGGLPDAAPGDTLTVTGGTDPSLTLTNPGPSYAGAYSFAPGAQQPVTFDGIEGLASSSVELSLTNTDGQTTAVPRTMLTYIVTVTNAGTLGVPGVGFADPIPSGLTDVSWSSTATSGATGNTASGSGDIADTLTVPVGATVTYTISGALPASTPAGTLTNTATLSPPAGVTNTAPNRATDTDTVTPKVGVSVTNTDGQTSAVPGTSVTYIMTVTNAGPSTAAGVSFADSLPAALTDVSWTSTTSGGATGNTASGTGNITDTLTLAPGTTVTYRVTGTVAPAATGTLTTTTTATVPAGETNTGTPTTAIDSDSVAPTVGVSVTNTDGQTSAVPGTSVTYIMTVTNAGSSTAAGVSFADSLPAVLTGVSWTSTTSGGATGNTASGTGNITDTLTLATGSTVTYRVTGTVAPAATGTLTTTATIGSGETKTGTLTTATDTDTLTPSADVGVSISAPSGATIGTPFTYTIMVTNAGPSTALGAQLAHPLPANATNAAVTASQGTVTTTNSLLVAAIGALAPGASATITVTVTPTAAGNLELTATATAGTTDPASANNAVTAGMEVSSYPSFIVVGPGSGGGPTVQVLNAQTGALIRSFQPFGTGWTGSISVAQGDLTGDGVPEVVIGAGPGGGPRVMVFDVQTGAVLGNFFTYDSQFRGGVNVAAGDVTGGGYDDIVTGAGSGGGPNVRVFDGRTDAQIGSFYAYSSSYTGGVNVAAGDVTGGGYADIVTGAGPGGGPNVRVFDGRTDAQIGSFYAYSSSFTGGVNVVAGDVTGGGYADIVTGAGPGGGPNVRVFDATTGSMRSSFIGFDESGRGGVSVAAVLATGQGSDDVVLGTGYGAPAQVGVYNGLTGQLEDLFAPFGASDIGGVYVG